MIFFYFNQGLGKSNIFIEEKRYIMKKLALKFSFFAAFLCVLGSLMQCKEKNPKLLVDYEINLDQPDPKLKPFDSTLINSFFENFRS
jgi:hypothetical protein